MEDWPAWFLEALKRRFDELSLIAEQQNQTSPLMEQHMKKHMDETIRNLIIEWEDALTCKYSFEKEWLYMEGVKDGISITRPIQSSRFP